MGRITETEVLKFHFQKLPTLVESGSVTNDISSIFKMAEKPHIARICGRPEATGVGM